MAERSRVSRRMADEQLAELRALMSDMPPSVRRDIQYGTGVSDNVRTGNVQPFRRQDLVEALDYASLIPTGFGDVADIASFGVSALEPGFIRRALTPPQWTPNANPGMRGVDLNAPGRNPLSYTPPFSLNPSEENMRLTSLLPLIPAMTAFHGTPHRFKAEKLVELPDGTTRWLDETMEMPQGARVLEEAPHGRFRSSQIGTGEGAQAYGHGIYLAENPDVALNYVPRDFEYEDALMSRYKNAEAVGDIDAMEAYETAMMHNTPKQIDELMGSRATNAREEIRRLYESSDSSNLYTVDLPDDQIERMLDWDAPLSEQPEGVRNAVNAVYDQTAMTHNDLKKLGIDETRDILKSIDRNGDYDDLSLDQLREVLDSFRDDDPVGWENYLGGRPISGQNGKSIMLQLRTKLRSDERVSRLLEQAGIPGIKYFDGGSRAAGEGTRNFVVFDENILKILGRE